VNGDMFKYFKRSDGVEGMWSDGVLEYWSDGK